MTITIARTFFLVIQSIELFKGMVYFHSSDTEENASSVVLKHLLVLNL